MSVPAVRHLLAASEAMRLANDELRAEQHDEAADSICAMSLLIGMWIAKITIEYSRRTSETGKVS